MGTTDKLLTMGKSRNNLIFKYLLVLCLSITLLLAQSNRFHMHLEHDDPSDTSAHVVDMHTASILHDFDLTHHDGVHEDHHTAAIDLNPDNLIKKINVLNPLSLLLLFVGLFLIMPRRACTYRQRYYKILSTLGYYLLQPPLRAPPAN
jgi:hypothetical protein